MEDVIKLTSSKDSVIDDILSFAGNIQPQKMVDSLYTFSSAMITCMHLYKYLVCDVQQCPQ